MNYEISIPLLIALLALFVSDGEGVFPRFIIGKGLRIEDRSSIRLRLAKLGKDPDEGYENFRLAQMSAIAIATSTFTALYLLQFLSFTSLLLLLLASASAIVYGFEKNLSNRCARQSLDVEGEFPAFIEMLALAIGAGESPISALKLISKRASGKLSSEFSTVIRELEQGQPLTSALDSMSRRVSSVAVRRFVDSLIISLSRGTPLVETLTHNVNESRSQERVRLLAAAGKSEVAMMIPVVFLILPISILFALFPSISTLDLFGT